MINFINRLFRRDTPPEAIVMKADGSFPELTDEQLLNLDADVKYEKSAMDEVVSAYGLLAGSVKQITQLNVELNPTNIQNYISQMEELLTHQKIYNDRLYTTVQLKLKNHSHRAWFIGCPTDYLKQAAVLQEIVTAGQMLAMKRILANQVGK